MPRTQSHIHTDAASVKEARKACREKFLRFFPDGFHDPKYFQWERNYKWEAHEAWIEKLGRDEYEHLLEAGEYQEIARRAVRLETKTNLLFSFEKMALRDAVKSVEGAEQFADGLYQYVYGSGNIKERFEQFTEVLAALPRYQTRVLTWPLQTVFGFIANPKEFIFLKPKVTQTAARHYGYDFKYQSRPAWRTYDSFLGFAMQIRKDLADLKPRDMIDIQSFMWMIGSDEYTE